MFHVDTFEGLSNITLEDNDTAIMQCIAEGFPTPRLSLIKDNSTLDAFNEVSEGLTKSHLTFKITFALGHDSGTYTCIASNTHGQSRRYVHVQILKPPTVMSIDDAYINEGDSLNKSCIYHTGFPPETDIQWTKDETVVSNGTLWILKVARTDAGIYTCRATNTHTRGRSNFTGCDWEQFKLHVLYQPFVQKFSVESFGEVKNVTLLENTTVEFHCIGEGFPPPDLRLVNSNLNMDISTGMSSESTTTSLRHILAPAQCKYLGKYTCIASNKIGLGGMDLFLNILCPVRRNPAVSKTEDDNNIAFRNIGDAVTFAFEAQANPTPGRSDISLKKCTDSNPCTEITNDSNIHITTNGTRITLYLGNVSESDYGIYVLQVDNGIGKPHTEVYILKRPRLSEDATQSVILSYIIIAGISIFVFLAIPVVVFCVCTKFNRSNSRAIVEVELPTIVPSTFNREGHSIQSSPLASAQIGEQSLIYHEIDPQLSEFDTPIVADGINSVAQTSCARGRYEDLDRSLHGDESQYLRVVAD
ncbi:hemicentin-2-like [Dreissena polymorpha]|uniref:hemicentin-2-like n=1 Tax=Dreissena polymorpha TaxID=45954 RepID=UPI002264051C|nr:hemicentin-2-like [Dreissena polymorpha]